MECAQSFPGWLAPCDWNLLATGISLRLESPSCVTISKCQWPWLFIDLLKNMMKRSILTTIAISLFFYMNAQALLVTTILAGGLKKFEFEYRGRNESLFRAEILLRMIFRL
jgi:hypothetical protein